VLNLRTITACRYALLFYARRSRQDNAGFGAMTAAEGGLEQTLQKEV